MDKITIQLLAIESEAQEAMKAIEKENAQLVQKAREELARRVAEIEKDGEAAIRKLQREAKTDTVSQIERIREEYRHKVKTLDNEFAENKNIWRGKIFHDVLYPCETGCTEEKGQPANNTLCYERLYGKQ